MDGRLNIKKKDHLLDGNIRNCLANGKASAKGLDALLEDSRQLTELLMEESEQEKRIRYFEQSVDHLLQSCFPTPSKPEEIKIQLSKGQSYQMFGAWDKALATFRSVIDLCDSEDLIPQKAKAYRFIGYILMMQNKFAEASESYEQSLRLIRDRGDAKGQAWSYNGLAFCHFENGALEGAISYWQQALQLARKIDDYGLLAEINNNLGIVANVKGEWQKALAHYDESLRYFEKITDRRGCARTYHNIAKTHADSKCWADAGLNYEKSYELAKELGDAHLRANITLNRVELYIVVGDLELAESLCHRALRAYQRLGDHLGQADVFKFLGVIFTTRHYWSEAQDCFGKSIRLTRKYESPLCEAEALFEQGRMWKQKGDDKLAQKQFGQALNLFAQVKAHKQMEKVKQELTRLPQALSLQRS